MKTQIFKTQITTNIAIYRLHKYISLAFLFFGFFVFWFLPVKAENDININLRIETPEQIILNQQVSVPDSCEVIDSAGTTSTFTGHKAICILQSAQEQGILTYQATNWGFAFALDSINSINNASDWSQTWLVYKNNIDPGTGIDGFSVNENDNLLFTYGPWPMEPLEVYLPTTTIELGQTITLTTKYWDNANLDNYESEVNFVINGTMYNSPSGTLEYTPQAEGQEEIFVEATGKTRSEKKYLTVNPTPETASTNYVTVSYLQNNIFAGEVITTSTWFSDTSENFYHNTSTISALGVLAQASRQGNFSVKVQNFDWGYYVSQINGYSPAGFDGWIYNVNQQDPGWTGINDYPIQNNDSLQIFYSIWPWKIEASCTSSLINEPVIFTAYEYASSTWNPAPSTTISINGQLFDTDSSGQYSYSTSTTSTVSAYIYDSLNSLQNSPAVSVTFWENSTTTDEGNTDANNNSGNNGGGNNENNNTQPTTHKNPDIAKAIEFLSANEHNGQIGSSAMYTDWAAIASGAFDSTAPTAQNIKNYLLTDPNPLVGLNQTSDYARRAMALMSLGINPYNGTKTNYVKKLTDKFDGTQFGDPNLYNDDIFAIIPLLHTGYSENDEIIQKTVQFILTKQNSNGSWNSVDLTAAAIQALAKVKNLAGVNEALDKAKNYLKNNQQADGGFGNIPATAWTMQAISSLNEDQNDWLKNNLTPGDYLATNQAEDGGTDKDLTINNRLWNTAYTIPAAMEKTWQEILHDFGRPQENGNPNSVATQAPDTNNPTPTSTADCTDAPECTPTTTTTTTTNCTDTPWCVSATTTTLEMTNKITTTTCTDTPWCVSTVAIATTTNCTEDAPWCVSATTSVSTATTSTPNKKIISNNETMSRDNSTAPIITTNETLSASATTTIPYQQTAKGIFATTATLAGGLGIFLVWRLLQTLV